MTNADHRLLGACLCTALFAAFPFSRQAIAWPGAVYNPLVSGLTAGALLAYDRARRDGGLRWFVLSLVLAILAPLCYEAGLMVAPLLMAMEMSNWLWRRWPRRFSWWTLGSTGVFLGTFLLWHTMRPAGVTGFGLNPADLHRNLAYLV